MTDAYDAAGYGAGRRIGFGMKPGVVVVDLQAGLTDPQFPSGQHQMVHSAVANSAVLLKAARAIGAPVANIYTAYSSARDTPHWKLNVAAADFYHGAPATELDPHIYDASYDAKFCKAAPSAFFQTAVVQYLIKERVDTVFVVGCMTSGCIRASVIDAFSYGFRVMVPEHCCGDVDEGPHRDNLRDIGRRYADILTLEESLKYFDTLTGS